MEPTTLSILKIGLKVITPIFKITKSKLEKELYIYCILRKYNSIKINSDFDSVYLETLYQLIKIRGKNKLIVALFELKEVMESFKDEIYGKNNWAFEVNLDSNLHTNPQLRKLKDFDINLQNEIDEFKLEFKNVANLTNNPKELEQQKTIKDIRKEVGKLINTQVLNEKFKTNIEIKNQVLLSKSEIQPLSDHISMRKELVNAFIENYKSKKWLAINGSVSTGKTQFSVLLAQNFNSTIYWINLRDFNDTNFIFKIISDLSSFLSLEFDSDILLMQNRIIEKIEPGSLIILDDIPRLDFRNQAASKFISFVTACLTENILIFSTSNYEIPIQIKELLFNDSILETTIENLSVEEIFETLLTYNISEDIANSLKIFIHSLSSGHPVIVKAICNYLEQKNWVLSHEELKEIFNEDYSISTNEDTYLILTKTITDDNTRHLLYRLNIIIGNFTLEDVKIVGGCSPIIENPIEKFYNSVGLWIQKKDSKKYELSPLLKKLQTHNLSPELEKNICLTLGKKILNKKNIDQFDASKAITYFIKAESYNDAGFVLILVLKEALDNPKVYFDWGLNLFWYTMPLPKEMDIFLQISIRCLQILLNQQENKDLNFLISDLEQICELGLKNGINVSPAYLILSNHYSIIDSKKSLKYLMTGNSLYKDFLELVDNNENLSSPLDFETMIWGSVISINTLTEITNWFETIGNLEENQIINLKQSENVDSGSIFIFRNIILNEEKKHEEDRDWNNIISIFSFVQEKALSLNLDLMYANAIRYIVNIYSDKLNDILSAHNYVINNIHNLSENKTAQFLVNDAIGRQLFYHNMIEEASEYIFKAIDLDINSFYTEKLDTYLVISQIVGRQDCQLALNYSIKAKEFANENEFTSDILRAKVIGEYAISLFINNNTIGAIYALEEGYQVLIKSYNISSEYHIVILRYGHVLNYWYQLLTTGKAPEKEFNGNDYEVPKRGIFLSNYKDKFVEEIYFDERRLFVSYLFYNSFEYLSDFKLARKWAYNNISIHRDIDFNYFSLVLSYAIPYLIIDKKYNDAIELQIEVIDSTNKQSEVEIDHERLGKSEFLKNLIKDRPKSIIKNYDDLIIEFSLLPILLNYITSYGNQLNVFSQHINLLDDLILNLKSKFKDIVFLESVSNIYSAINRATQNDIPKQVNEIVEKYDGEFKDYLKIIGYVISSVYCTSIVSLKYHFAIIGRLESTFKKSSKGTYYYILIPFLENFWFNRIENNRVEFSELRFLETKSIQYYRDSNIDNKIKTLFKLLVHHLDYQTTNKEDDWLDN